MSICNGAVPLHRHFSREGSAILPERKYASTCVPISSTRCTGSHSNYCFVLSHLQSPGFGSASSPVGRSTVTEWDSGPVSSWGPFADYYYFVRDLWDLDQDSEEEVGDICFLLTEAVVMMAFLVVQRCSRLLGKHGWNFACGSIPGSLVPMTSVSSTRGSSALSWGCHKTLSLGA